MDNIDELKAKPLSNYEIMNALNNKVNMLTYDELVNYDDIDHVLGKYGVCVLLVETKENNGHWICMFKTISDNKKKEPIVSFFDSYALPVDDQLHFVNMKFREENNMLYPYLSYLLYKCPYPIEYNEHQFQKLSPQINTCGRWVILRLLLKHLSLKKFYKLFKPSKKIDSDDLVTILTKNI